MAEREPTQTETARPPASETSPVGALWARAALLVVPGLWLGLLIGISLIEAPLKFTAPGITIPLGLGIGQRVFLAMNIVELVLAVVLILALISTRGRPALRDRLWCPSLGILAVLGVKTLILRPLLHQRTAAVLAGESDGGSLTHYFYIAADGLLLVLLSLLVLRAARTLLTMPTPTTPSTPGPQEER